MAYNVKFLRGASSSYTALAAKDERTFYYTTDDQQLYLGAIKLSNGADLEQAITRIAANEGEIAAIKTALGTLTQTAFNELKGRMDAAEAEINTLKNNKADKATTLAGYGITNAYTKGEVDEIVATIESGDSQIGATVGELRTDVDTIKADYLKKTDKEELQTQITKNANAIEILSEGVDPTKIDSVKELIDYVDTHGAEVTGMKADIVKAQEAADAAQEYAEGVANNLSQEVTNRTNAITGLQTQLDEVKETANAAATQEALQAEITRATGVESGLNTRLQTVETVIGEVESVAVAIETAKGEAIAIAAGDATNKADAAKNASKAYTDEEIEKITLTTGSVEGSVAFKGTDVLVKGLKSAAYAEATAFDAAGSAETAKGEAIAIAAGDATVKASAAKSEAIAAAATDATEKANTAEANAKTYVDVALTWGTIAE